MKVKQGWVSVDDRLPEYEKEVVVLVQKPYYGKDEYMVAYGHRPNPNGYVITKTGEHIYAKLYDAGGWNQPDVRYWLDVPMPNEQCDNIITTKEMTDEERAYNYASTRKGSKFQTGEIAKYYNDGYQQAKKYIINKACEWLYNRQTVDLEVPNIDKFINDFKKAMEE